MKSTKGLWIRNLLLLLLRVLYWPHGFVTENNSRHVRRFFSSYNTLQYELSFVHEEKTLFYYWQHAETHLSATKANTGGQKIYLKDTLWSLLMAEVKNSVQIPDLLLKRKIKNIVWLTFLLFDLVACSTLCNYCFFFLCCFFDPDQTPFDLWLEPRLCKPDSKSAAPKDCAYCYCFDEHVYNYILLIYKLIRYDNTKKYLFYDMKLLHNLRAGI